MSAEVFATAPANTGTGGIRSPMVGFTLVPFSEQVGATGWSRTVKLLLALLATAYFSFVALPASWFAPEVPQPAFWIILLGTFGAAVAIHARYVLALTRTLAASAHALQRAREEMVARALARARDMEQMAAKLSHELKNPLTAIKGLVQLCARAAVVACAAFTQHGGTLVYESA